MTEPPSAASPAVPAGPRVLLVGVAHVLDLEAALDRVLSEFHPKALAVELDPDRARSLQEKAAARDRGEPEADGARRDAPFLLQMWSRVQERLASSFGGLPGEEMLQVGRYAKRNSLPCFLVDDPIQQIAGKLLRSLTPKERVQLVVSTVLAMFIPAKVVEHQIQQYEAQPEEYLQVMREQYPTMARVLLDERNEHMAGRIRALAGSFGRVAAVVGDAHVAGLAQLLGQGGVDVTRVPLSSLTAPAAVP